MAGRYIVDSDKWSTVQRKPLLRFHGNNI